MVIMLIYSVRIQTCGVFSKNRAVAKGMVHIGGSLGTSMTCNRVATRLPLLDTSKAVVVKLYIDRSLKKS